MDVNCFQMIGEWMKSDCTVAKTHLHSQNWLGFQVDCRLADYVGIATINEGLESQKIKTTFKSLIVSAYRRP